MYNKRTIGILLFDDAEVLDFCGPFEVFSIAGKLLENSFEVTTIAQKSPIVARNGLQVIPNHVIGTDNIPALDILLVPGGIGTVNEVKNQSLISWIKDMAAKTQYVISVCTGVALLGKAGLIDGMIVTTHHRAYDRVRPDCPNSKFCTCRRFIDNGKVLTSAGISAGIDVSFYFIKQRLGVEEARKVADHMEYDWKDVPCDKCTCNPH